MLRIKINGDRLDLNPDPSIGLVIENPFLLQDRIPAAHTISFSLPTTRRNLSLLSNPNRLNRSTYKEEFDGASLEFGPNVLLRGVLFITKTQENIEAFIRGSVLTQNIKSTLPDQELEYFDFGLEDKPLYYDFDDVGSVAHQYKELMNSSIDEDENFVVAPIRFSDAQWPSLEDNRIPFSNGIRAMYELYANFYNSSRDNCIIKNIDTGYGSHGACFPSPYLHYVIDQIFGDSLEVNPFVSGELSKLVLTNFFNPDFTSTRLMQNMQGVIIQRERLGGPGSDWQNSLEVADFCSSQSFAETLKSILKMFCMTLMPQGNQYKIVYNSEVLLDEEVIDWTGLLIGKINILSTEKAQTYNYGYLGFEESIAPSGIDEKATIKALHDQSLVDEGDEEDFYVPSTRQVIRKKFNPKYDPGDDDTYTHEVIITDFGFSAGDYNMMSEITPLINNIKNQWYNNTGFQASPSDPIGDLHLSGWYVPETESERTKRPDKPNIMIYWGLVEGLDDQYSYINDSNIITVASFPTEYPFLSSHNYDGRGNRLGDLSLHWEGNDGLLETYHQEFIDFISKDKVRIEAIFKLESYQLANIDLLKRRNVKGKNFFIERIETTIRMDKIDPSLVRLIEAPFVSTSSGSGSGAGGL